jgi:replicative DNA helicase
MNDIAERGLPASLDCERAVLGALLLDQNHLQDVRNVLAPTDFMLEKHRRIWLRIVDLYDSGQPVDTMTVGIALRDAGQLESVDGVTYLASLYEGLPQQPSLDSYVRTLKDDAARRKIITFADNLIRRAANRERPQAILDSIANEDAPEDGGLSGGYTREDPRTTI